MLTLDEIESGLFVTHKNTGLRYSVVEAEDDEVLLSPEQEVALLQEAGFDTVELFGDDVGAPTNTALVGLRLSF